jgi:hypothetical protein
MPRTRITGGLVSEIERLLDRNDDHATIAAGLDVGENVVSVIAGDKLRVGRPQVADLHEQRMLNGCRGIGAPTVRMVQRMLQVGILNQQQIAREAGVSPHIVEQVAAGLRGTVSTERPFVFADLDERFMPVPVRCAECGVLISVVPCRACRARQN